LDPFALLKPLESLIRVAVEGEQELVVWVLRSAAVRPEELDQDIPGVALLEGAVRDDDGIQTAREGVGSVHEGGHELAEKFGGLHLLALGEGLLEHEVAILRMVVEPAEAEQKGNDAVAHCREVCVEVRSARGVQVVSRPSCSTDHVLDVAFLPAFAHAEAVEVDANEHLLVELVQVLGGFEDSQEAARQQQLLGAQDQRWIPLLDADVVEVYFLALAHDVEVQGIPAPPAASDDPLDASESTVILESDKHQELPHDSVFRALLLELPCLVSHSPETARLLPPDVAL